MTKMRLSDTEPLMISSDYKDRFIAEWAQAKIRYDRLHDILVKHDAGKLEFTPTCSIDLLKAQHDAMRVYLYTLEVRAVEEDIILDEEEIIKNRYDPEDLPQGWVSDWR